MMQPLVLGQSSQIARCPCAAPASHGLGISRAALRPAVKPAHRSAPVRQQVTVRAEGSSEFDSILSDIADKFERNPNKGAVIAWVAATAFAIFFSEWLIHLPLFNVLLGFPIQLFGLLLLPYLGIKYLDEKDDYQKDFTDVAEKVISKLPGLK